jgi:hypothetical protein
MLLESARLIIVDIWRIKPECRSNFYWPEGEEVSVPCYSPDGTWWGTRTFIQIEAGLPQLWVNHVKKVYLHPHKLGQYFVVHLIVELLAEAVQLIIESEGPKYWSHLDNLLSSISTVIPEAERVSYHGRAQLSSILFLEPVAPIKVSKESDDAELIESISELRTFLKHSDNSAAIPHFLFEVLFFYSSANYPSVHGTAVNLSGPVKYNNAIPLAVLNLVNYIGYYTICNDLVRILRKNPFFEKTPLEYISSLGSVKNIFSNYENIFLKDRENTIESCSLTANQLRIIDDELSDNVISFLNDSNSFVIQTLTRDHGNYPYRYSLVTRLKREFEKERNYIKQQLSLINNYERALSDHLRDWSFASINRTNLELQKSIHRLTVAMIIVAIIALFIGLFPEEPKKTIYETMIKNLFGWL